MLLLAQSDLGHALTVISPYCFPPFAAEAWIRLLSLSMDLEAVLALCYMRKKARCTLDREQMGLKRCVWAAERVTGVPIRSRND